MSDPIDVYVRLGPNRNENERTLSFKRPPDIPDDDFLDNNFAIDGQDIVASVVRVQAEKSLSLGDLLRQEQVRIRDWMKDHGYEVVFV